MNIYTWVDEDGHICFGDKYGVPDVIGTPGRWFYWSRSKRPVKDLGAALRGAYGWPWPTALPGRIEW